MNGEVKGVLVVAAIGMMIAGVTAIVRGIILLRTPKCPSCGQKMTVSGEDDLPGRHRRHWTCSCGEGGATDFLDR